MILATDYFTKWIEAKLLASTTWKNINHFVWKPIICHFGAPRVIVIDNGPQFYSKCFKDLCDVWDIIIHFASVTHPQSNGLSKSVNKNILKPLRKRVKDAKGYWPV